MKIVLLTTICLLGVLVFAGCQAIRSGYESAPYTVKRLDNNFEIRIYPKLIFAETPTDKAGDSNDGSFMRLFRYITGSNEQNQKIPMTTPVFMANESEQPMMAFVLPKDFNPSHVPAPKDSKVKIREIQAGEFAVLRFKGARSLEKESDSLTRLEEWLNNQHIKSVGNPMYAYFDPPWTPTFLRRNEVMLRLEPNQ